MRQWPITKVTRNPENPSAGVAAGHLAGIDRSRQPEAG